MVIVDDEWDGHRLKKKGKKKEHVKNDAYKCLKPSVLQWVL